MDQGATAKTQEVDVIIHRVEREDELPPQWQNIGSSSLDDIVIEINENENVGEKLNQVMFHF